MQLNIPDEIIKSARMSDQEMLSELAIMLFGRDKLTLGQAARLCGLTTFQFQHLLAGRGIPLHYDVDEFEADLRTLERLGSMIVVSDSSPLIALAAIEQLSLLQVLYGRVLVPDAVYREVCEAMSGARGADLVRKADWIEARPISDKRLNDALSMELDPGEAEAIVLALEQRADLLLMDERRGRATALRMGCEVVGVLGVLVEARRVNLIPHVRPLPDSLLEYAGFRVSERLYRAVLESVGENG